MSAAIRDPAVAIAVAKCWLASKYGASPPDIPAVTVFHPEECPFCDFERDGMMEALEEFVAWSGISSDEETPLRLQIESWLTLPSEVQEQHVKRAQGG